jgi:cytochrome c oxidase cbb3-type subunit III
MKSYFKSTHLLVTFILLPLFATSQKVSVLDDALNWAFNNIFIVATFLLIALVFGKLWGTMNDITEYHRKAFLIAKGIDPDAPEAKEVVLRESWISKLWTYAAGLVPKEKEQDLDLGHEYDGIRELDNSLPPWWLWLFYFTIAFSAVYLYYYTFTDKGPRQAEEYAMEMENAEIQKASFLKLQANTIDESNVEILKDAPLLAEGKAIFKANCAVCHGNEGQGTIGPNLTDNYWKHGNTINDIFKVVKYGVIEKGMIAWQTQLNPAAMQKVSSYITTLAGTNPPNPKAAEGELYDPTQSSTSEK